MAFYLFYFFKWNNCVLCFDTDTRNTHCARLTYQRAVEKQRHSEQRADAEGQDEGPPPAPAQCAAVAGRADQGGEHEAEDGTEEPRQAVVLLGKTCADTHKETQR